MVSMVSALPPLLEDMRLDSSWRRLVLAALVAPAAAPLLPTRLPACRLSIHDIAATGSLSAKKDAAEEERGKRLLPKAEPPPPR